MFNKPASGAYPGVSSRPYSCMHYGCKQFYSTGPSIDILNKKNSERIKIFNRTKEAENFTSSQYYKLFTAVITPLAVYFSMILTVLR
jgi:hypothetical protein